MLSGESQRKRDEMRNSRMYNEGLTVEPKSVKSATFEHGTADSGLPIE
jgi:hypothetical protein